MATGVKLQEVKKYKIKAAGLLVGTSSQLSVLKAAMIISYTPTNNNDNKASPLRYPETPSFHPGRAEH